MNYRKKLIAYIDAMHAGNRRAAAKAWGVNYSTLSGVINAYKGMGRSMAQAICVRTGFALELESLARIRPVPGKRDRANEGAAV